MINYQEEDVKAKIRAKSRSQAPIPRETNRDGDADR